MIADRLTHPVIDPLLMAGHGIVEICEEARGVSQLEVRERRSVLRAAGHELASPYGMVQERVYRGDDLYSWRIIVTCCLMNRTHARQVRPIIGPLFGYWPTPAEMVRASVNLEDLIRPLGFVNNRSKSIRNMSADVVAGVHPKQCRGVGQFGRDAVDAFVYGITDIKPNDGFLAKYCEWVEGGRKE